MSRMKKIYEGKRIVAALLAVVVTLTAIPLEVFAGTTELLTNGNFSENSFTGWKTQGEVALFSDNAISGNYATLTGGAELAELQSDTVEAQAEKNYVLSASVCSYDGAILRAEILQYSDSAESEAGVIEVPLAVEKNEWDEFSFVFQTAADVSYIAVRFENSAGCVQLDNVSVKPTAKYPVYNPEGTTISIENADFSKGLKGWSTDGNATTSSGFLGHGVSLTPGSTLSQEEIELKKGSLYELHYYIKATNANACESSISLQYRDGNDEVKTVTPHTLTGNSAADGWQEVTAQFETEYVNSKATLKLEVTKRSSTVGAEVSFDEITLTLIESYADSTPFALSEETTTNLYTNGSFVLDTTQVAYGEENFAMTVGFADKKIKWTNGNTANFFTYSVIEGTDHGNALKVQGKTTGNSQLQQTINWELGKTYVISYWMKTGDAKVRDFKPIVAGTMASSSSVVPPSSTRIENKAITEWTKFEFEFTPTEANVGTTHLKFMFDLRSTEQIVYLADVQVVEKPIIKKRLDNGTFEEGTKSWTGFVAENITDGVSGGAESGSVLKVTGSGSTVIKHDAFTEPLVVGQKYTLRFRARNNALTGSEFANVYMTKKDGTGKVAESKLSATNGIWKEYVVDFVAEAGYEYPQLCIDLTNASAQGVEFAFADFSFSEYTPILSNGDFSNGTTDWSVVRISDTSEGHFDGLVEDDTQGTVMKISKPREDTNVTDLRHAKLQEPLTIGQNYTISFDIKTSGTSASDASYSLLLRNESLSGAIEGVKEGGTQGEWKHVSYEFTVTEGYQKLNVWVRINTCKDSSLEIIDYYITNVKVERSETVTKGESEIPNGDYSSLMGTYPEQWGLLGNNADEIKAHAATDISTKVQEFYPGISDNGVATKISDCQIKGEEVADWTQYSFEYTPTSASGIIRFMYLLTSEYQTVYLADVKAYAKDGDNANVNILSSEKFKWATGDTVAANRFTWSTTQDAEHGNVLKVSGKEGSTGTWLAHNVNWEVGRTYVISYWAKTSTAIEVSQEMEGYIEAKNNSGSPVGASTLLPVYENAEFTLNFWVKANAVARQDFTVRLTSYADYNRSLVLDTTYPTVTLKDTDEWQCVAVKITPQTGVQYIDISFYTSAVGGTFKLSEVENVLGETARLNWSFEIGDEKPISWTYNGSGLFTKVQDGVDGNYAAMISDTTTGQLNSATFDVEPDTTYEFSYWIKTDGEYYSTVFPRIYQKKEDGSAASGIVYTTANSTYRTISGTITFPWTLRTYGTTDWKQVRYYFQTAEDAATVSLNLSISGQFTSVSVDHVTIEKKEPVVNLDFEEADENGKPESWYLTDVFSLNPELRQDTSVWHSGGSSVYVNLDANTKSQRLSNSKLIPITAEGDTRVYELSFWVASRNANSKNVRCDLWYYDEAGIKLYSGSVSDVDASRAGIVKTLNASSEMSEWSQVMARLAVPVEAKYVSISFNFSRGSGEIWLDDIFFDQVESDTEIVVDHEDFHAVDHEGNISGWVAENGTLAQQEDTDEGTYGFVSGGSMVHRTATLSTAYSYAIAIRYKSDYQTNLQLRYNDYMGVEQTEVRQTYTLPATLGWHEEVITFTAASATTCDVVIGNGNELSVSQLIIYQTARPSTKVTWEGKWIGYSATSRKTDEYDHSYYRKKITLSDDVTYAPIQITGDDRFALYVNGKEVYNGVNDDTSTWASVQVLQLEDYLVKGENILAIDVYNLGDYGGLIFDGIWTFADGTTVKCMSGGDTLCLNPDPTGDWKALNYDDSAWSRSVIYGDVPMGPWGDIYYEATLYADNLIEVLPAEGEDSIVNDLEYEFSIKIKLEEKLDSQLPFTMVLWRKNSITSICKLTPIFLDNEDMTKWPVNEWFTVKMKVTLPNYLDSGNYTLQLSDDYFVIGNEEIYDNKFINFKVVNDYTATNLVTKVETINGVPTLTVNGEKVPAFFFKSPSKDSSLETISQSGIEIYLTNTAHIGKSGDNNGLWNENGSFDYETLDETINSYLAASPDANVIVQIGLTAPIWWLTENPDEQANSIDSAGNITTYWAASYGSEKWKVQAGELLKDIIAHMQKENYYSRVAGLYLLSGYNTENVTYGALDASQVPDYSVAAQNYFRKWAKEEYGTIENLREAWNDPTIESFDSIEPPTFAELKEDGGAGMMYNPATQQKLIDWRKLLSVMTTDCLLYWGEIAKEATEQNLVVGTYYSYLGAGATWDGVGSSQWTMNDVISSEYYDFFTTPEGYNARQLGIAGVAQGAIDTVMEFGKLYIQEQDNRTVLSGQFAGTGWDTSRDQAIGQARTMEDSILQYKRDFTHNLVNGIGSWIFDMQGGWIADEQIYDFTQDMNDEYTFVNYMERDVVNDVAIFASHSMVSTPRTNEMNDANGSYRNQVITSQDLGKIREQLNTTGVGFDFYGLTSLVDDVVPEHKINIFMGANALSEAERTAIEKYCKNNGQINIFLYMSGYVDEEGYSLENMTELTGFEFGLNDVASSGQVRVIDSGTSYTESIVGDVFGAQANTMKYYLQEFYVQPSDDQIVLGTLVDSGNIGFAVKDMGDWTSVYCAAPYVTAEFLRNLMGTTDIHVYSDNPSDTVWSNNSYVGVHSAESGVKTIHLPDNYAVYDVFEKKYISMDTNVITYENQVNDTHLFRLTPVNTYSFLSYVKGGHGTISEVGLEQLQPGTSKTIKITPDEGYMIRSVTINGQEVEVGDDNTIHISGINNNQTVVVRFKKLPTPIPTEDSSVGETSSVVGTASSGATTGETPTEEQSIGEIAEDVYEEIWATVRDIISIPWWLLLLWACGIGGVIFVIRFLIIKRKEKRNEK